MAGYIYHIQTPKGEYIGKKVDLSYLEYHFKNACPDFIKQQAKNGFFNNSKLNKR